MLTECQHTGAPLRTTSNASPAPILVVSPSATPTPSKVCVYVCVRICICMHVFTYTYMYIKMHVLYQLYIYMFRTAWPVSRYCYVLLLCMRHHTTMCPHATTRVRICVLILLCTVLIPPHMYPILLHIHTAVCTNRKDERLRKTLRVRGSPSNYRLQNKAVSSCQAR